MAARRVEISLVVRVHSCPSILTKRVVSIPTLALAMKVSSKSRETLIRFPKASTELQYTPTCKLAKLPLCLAKTVDSLSRSLSFLYQDLTMTCEDE